MNWLYLIHFTDSYHHAGHYLGATTNLKERLHRHHRSEGSRLLEVINEAGITWQLARCWRTDDAFKIESRMKKNAKNGRSYCPLCNAKPRRINGLDDFPLNLLSFHTIAPFNPRSKDA